VSGLGDHQVETKDARVRGEAWLPRLSHARSPRAAGANASPSTPFSATMLPMVMVDSVTRRRMPHWARRRQRRPRSPPGAGIAAPPDSVPPHQPNREMCSGGIPAATHKLA
jgi:hypothetical protein